jgi:hypothetical protein
MYDRNRLDRKLLEELEQFDGPPVRMNEILRCVDDAAWQKFRLSLKGLSTNEKLKKLRSYKANNSGRCVTVRVENYLNALRRGGQLPPKRKK